MLRSAVSYITGNNLQVTLHTHAMSSSIAQVVKEHHYLASLVWPDYFFSSVCGWGLHCLAWECY